MHAPCKSMQALRLSGVWKHVSWQHVPGRGEPHLPAWCPSDPPSDVSLPSHLFQYGSHSSSSPTASEPSPSLPQEDLARAGNLPLDK